MSKTREPDITHPGIDSVMAVHAPRYAKDCPWCGQAAIDGRRITALHRSLVEFGYTTLTRDETDAAYRIALDREPSAEDGIIAKLIRSQLKEADIVQ